MIHIDPIDPNEWRSENSKRFAHRKGKHNPVRVLSWTYCPRCRMTWYWTRRGWAVAGGAADFEILAELPGCLNREV